MPKIITFIVLLILLSACNNHTVFTKYKAIENNKWQKDSIVSFKVAIKDTLSNNAIYVNLRNDKDYAFNNIFLIVEMDAPNKKQIIDTLEYKMTDDKGYFLGTGYTDIKENKLELKENIIFPQSGIYTFKIQQAMRKNGKENGVESLNGITDVGLQIENITP